MIRLIITIAVVLVVFEVLRHHAPNLKDACPGLFACLEASVAP